jgi:SAM-dependent methyltransferase
MGAFLEDCAAFCDWLQTPLGQYLLAREQQFVDAAVADIFGYYAVQIDLPVYDVLRNNRMPSRLTIGMSDACQLQCDPAQMPLASASVDLIVLPHTLDFHPDPHQVVREAERVLLPEGRLIILGFNPWSMWGAARLARRRHGMPWQGRFLGVSRVKDWLALMGLESAPTQIDCYRPPLGSERWLDRCEFLERVGRRWWPVGGAVYGMSAIKRVRGMRLLTPGWKRLGRVTPPGVAVPVPDRRDIQIREKG